MIQRFTTEQCVKIVQTKISYYIFEESHLVIEFKTSEIVVFVSVKGLLESGSLITLQKMFILAKKLSLMTKLIFVLEIRQ